MKRILFLFAMFLLPMLFSGCRLIIQNFTAPDDAETGTVITLDFSGFSEKGTNFITECGLVLQLPQNWRVVSAKAWIKGSPARMGSPYPGLYALEESPDYQLQFLPEPGYKVWVGTCTPYELPDGQSIEASVNVIVGDLAGEDSATETYILKAATGFIREGVWNMNDPKDRYDFSDITESTYVESIDVAKKDSPYAGIEVVWETYEFSHRFYGVVHEPNGHFYIVKGDSEILELDENLEGAYTLTVAGAEALTSITYLDGHLWVGDARGTHRIYRIDLESHETESFDISRFPDGIGTDGRYIYVVNTDESGDLNIVDPSSGEKVGILKTGVPDPVGITYDGNNLMVLDEGGDIYHVDTETGQTTYIFSTPQKGDDNTHFGPEGISYLSGVVVIGYGKEKKVILGDLGKRWES